MRLALLALVGLVLLAAAAPPADNAASRALRDAPRIVQANKAPIIAASNAGKRVVAVGDYGIVVLTDDGRSFRQARSVPTRAVLTSVFFLDDRRGWAAGHDGTVLGTTDGGETWQVLREEPGKERALLSVWFETPEHGLAVGQFGLAVETNDGGKSWQERRLLPGEAGERHLMQIFAGGNGLLCIAAEAGAILRSEDNGGHWTLVQTDNKGSFWTGVALKDGTLLAAGMRGHVYRSTDRGANWKEVQSGSAQSLTAAIVGSDGRVRLVGMSGTLLSSADQGQSFVAEVRPDRANLTTVAPGPTGDLLFTLTGVVATK